MARSRREGGTLNARMRKKQDRWRAWGGNYRIAGKLRRARGGATGLPHKTTNYAAYNKGWLAKALRSKRAALMARELTGGDRRRARELVRRGVLRLVAVDHREEDDETPRTYPLRYYHVAPSGLFAEDWRLFVWCLRDGLTNLRTVNDTDTVACVGFVRCGTYAGKWRAWGRLQWGHYATEAEAVAAADRFY